jgi:saccharopine dehydrogenase-like NADP-dependent oxidoreductase
MVMKRISVFGAGRSATALIDYLKEHAESNNWQINICDADENLAAVKCAGNERCIPHKFNAENITLRNNLIEESDLVISLLPPVLHIEIAKACLRYKKNLITASYVDDKMKGLDKEARAAGVLFLCEMGLDPGIDHMSSMLIIDDLKQKGATIKSYRSSTGGLVAPESDDNPWHYKFSWNPRNVVVAGSADAQYKKGNRTNFVPYKLVFKHIDTVEISGLGQFESYPNRNSLPYEELYGLDGIPTLYRGTLRAPGFCSAWAALVDMGYTSNTLFIEDYSCFTYRELSKILLGVQMKDLDRSINAICNEDRNTRSRLEWLGILEEKTISIKEGTPADVLEHLLLQKWKLGDNDKDMIVMQHEFEYELSGHNFKLVSSLVQIGQDNIRTAMSSLVGLPIAVYAHHLLERGTTLSGVMIPVHREIYEPVIKRLAVLGIKFDEDVKSID